MSNEERKTYITIGGKMHGKPYLCKDYLYSILSYGQTDAVILTSRRTKDKIIKECIRPHHIYVVAQRLRKDPRLYTKRWRIYYPSKKHIADRRKARPTMNIGWYFAVVLISLVFVLAAYLIVKEAKRSSRLTLSLLNGKKRLKSHTFEDKIPELDTYFST